MSAGLSAENLVKCVSVRDGVIQVHTSHKLSESDWEAVIKCLRQKLATKGARMDASFVQKPIDSDDLLSRPPPFLRKEASPSIWSRLRATVGIK